MTHYIQLILTRLTANFSSGKKKVRPESIKLTYLKHLNYKPLNKESSIWQNYLLKMKTQLI
jgi:hypothetical protein